MTPKEKAQELLSKFAVGGWRKEHSISCVDEILNTIYNEDFQGHLTDEIGANSYWEQVKVEIEALS